MSEITDTCRAEEVEGIGIEEKGEREERGRKKERVRKTVGGG